MYTFEEERQQEEQQTEKRKRMKTIISMTGRVQVRSKSSYEQRVGGSQYRVGYTKIDTTIII